MLANGSYIFRISDHAICKVDRDDERGIVNLIQASRPGVEVITMTTEELFHGNAIGYFKAWPCNAQKESLAYFFTRSYRLASWTEDRQYVLMTEHFLSGDEMNNLSDEGRSPCFYVIPGQSLMINPLNPGGIELEVRQTQAKFTTTPFDNSYRGISKTIISLPEAIWLAAQPEADIKLVFTAIADQRIPAIACSLLS